MIRLWLVKILWGPGLSNKSGMNRKDDGCGVVKESDIRYVKRGGYGRRN